MTPPTIPHAYGLAHYWSHGDTVTHIVAYVLLAMSIASWYYILSKSWSAWRIRRSAGALDSFWSAPSLEDGARMLQSADSENVFAPLALRSIAATNLRSQNESSPSLTAQIDRGELITRTLRQEIRRAAARMETGQTLLASVGATSPFIGLFGTVWSIYHALTAVALSGSMQIDKIAGPVGEALIMTALGLLVAIPAVLAYNAFTRINRVTLAELDGFAHDLQAYLTGNAA